MTKISDLSNPRREIHRNIFVETTSYVSARPEEGLKNWKRIFKRERDIPANARRVYMRTRHFYSP